MIRILDAHVANKIAAGEVVERPASVVKELVENSLDAGATRIRVEIEEGGKRLIRVTDDGGGIPPDELPLALAPHATSKIHDADDLFEVLTYGFRGEALASIGSVARCTIFSRVRGAELGARVTCEGSRVSAVTPAGGPEGTVVEVRDLFHDTPARRKFLKSDGAEIARINETLTRLALPVERLALEVTHNGKKVLACEPAPSFEARIVETFGRELKDGLVPVHATARGIELQGYIGLPALARPSSNRQYLFLNDRFILDRGITHAVSRGFEGFLMHRRYPVFFLALTVDPRLVDVNVHPTKAEVRFRERDAVYGAVHRAVKTALEEARPTPDLPMPTTGRPAAAAGWQVAEAGADARGVAPSGAPPQRGEHRVRAMEAMLFPRGPAPELPTLRPAPPQAAPAPDDPADPVRHDEAASTWSGRFLQIHRSWIVVEDVDGFYVVDQHALHERMLYEQILARAGRGEASSQELLVPEILELSPAEHARLTGSADELAAIGLRIAPFGGRAVAVEAVPEDLAAIGGRRLVEAILASDEDGTRGAVQGLRAEVAARRACRAAVKFNDALKPHEIAALIEWERTSPDSAACPHGRPTRMKITLEELERRFMRKE